MRRAKATPTTARPLAARRPTLAELTTRRPGFRLRARLVYGLLIGAPLFILGELLVSGALDFGALMVGRGVEVAIMVYALSVALVLRQLGAAAGDLDAGVRGQEDATAQGARVSRALAAWAEHPSDPVVLARALERPPQRLAVDRAMIPLLAAYKTGDKPTGLEVELQEVGTVLASPRALNDLITALIDAAIEASPAGETVMVSLEDAGAHARLRIADRGAFPRLPSPDQTLLAIALGGELINEERPGGGCVGTLLLPKVGGARS